MLKRLYFVTGSKKFPISQAVYGNLRKDGAVIKGWLHLTK